MTPLQGWGMASPSGLDGLMPQRGEMSSPGASPRVYRLFSPEGAIEYPGHRPGYSIAPTGHGVMIVVVPRRRGFVLWARAMPRVYRLLSPEGAS
jgi:hypothetical protein